MGLSTALLQPPSSFATTANLIELARTAKQYGGIYSSHIRDEGEGVFRAIDEAIQVGKGAGIPVDIIHMKIAHKKLWGRANEIIAMVQKARRGPRHPRQRLLHRGSEQSVFDRPPVGARRRPREAARAAQGSISAEADARGGHERPAELVTTTSRPGTGGPG